MVKLNANLYCNGVDYWLIMKTPNGNFDPEALDSNSIIYINIESISKLECASLVFQLVLLLIWNGFGCGHIASYADKQIHLKCFWFLKTALCFGMRSIVLVFKAIVSLKLTSIKWKLFHTTTSINPFTHRGKQNRIKHYVFTKTQDRIPMRIPMLGTIRNITFICTFLTEDSSTVSSVSLISQRLRIYLW